MYTVKMTVIAMLARALFFCRFTDTNVYLTGSVKILRTRHKIYVDIRIFFTVYTSVRLYVYLSVSIVDYIKHFYRSVQPDEIFFLNAKIWSAC